MSFIAVQCFQCSTMQVKQQKKSTNKWNCVVCGENQSLRKVFAQASMAKDVRGFVQTFNMSRDDHNSSSLLLSSNHQNKDDHKKRRSDWTEYLDYVDDNAADDVDGGGDGELEPLMIVTEMPKLKGSSGSKFPSSNDTPQTRVQKTAAKKVKRSFDETLKSQETRTADQALKWNVFKAKIQHSSSRNTSQMAAGSVSNWNAGNENELLPKQLHGATLASKWSSFITEDDYDDKLQAGRRESAYHRGGCLALEDDNALDKSLMNDDKVEDDIHPDFL